MQVCRRLIKQRLSKQVVSQAVHKAHVGIRIFSGLEVVAEVAWRSSFESSQSHRVYARLIKRILETQSPMHIP